MKTETIEVEGLPEGWKAVAYRVPKGNIEFVFIENMVREAKPQDKKCLIVEKTPPRRIVLESSTDIRKAVFGDWIYNNGVIEQWRSQKESQSTYRIWREVKETDIPLNSDDSTKWAEDLILQLPEHHEGRNSWLCHYGMSNQAEEKRKSSIFEYVKSVGRFNISKRKDK